MLVAAPCRFCFFACPFRSLPRLVSIAASASSAWSHAVSGGAFARRRRHVHVHVHVHVRPFAFHFGRRSRSFRLVCVFNVTRSAGVGAPRNWRSSASVFSAAEVLEYFLRRPTARPPMHPRSSRYEAGGTRVDTARPCKPRTRSVTISAAISVMIRRRRLIRPPIASSSRSRLSSFRCRPVAVSPVQRSISCLSYDVSPTASVARALSGSSPSIESRSPPRSHSPIFRSRMQVGALAFGLCSLACARAFVRS